MLIPSQYTVGELRDPSLSRRVNANSQLLEVLCDCDVKLIKKGEC